MGAWVNVSIADDVGTVSLQRPEVHNAFNEEVIADLSAAFSGLGGRSDIRAVVLRAEGKSFCAGADLNWMQKMVSYTYDENVQDAQALGHMLSVIRHCPLPVIARVHGAALGGGVGLLAACDLAVALDTATFALSEVKLGIIPAVISPYVLERIGPAAARRYFLTAERFTAAEAYRIGLLNEVTTTVEALDATISAWIQALRANGPQAVQAAKKLVAEVTGYDWDQADELTTRRIAERRISEEGQEGMHAFLAKRPAAWTVRK